MNLAMAFARALLAHGIDAVFGVLGDGNMQWLAGYQTLPGARWCPAWHEAGALGMADGYAVATGRVGVATVTMGPGLVQSLAALTAAVRTRSPLLVVTAELAGEPAEQAQAVDQSSLVLACGARYLPVDSAAGLGSALGSALHSARAGLPCVLAISLELFGVKVTEALPAPERLEEPTWDGDGLDAAIEALGHAARPLILLGRGGLAATSQARLSELGERVGAAMLTTVQATAGLTDCEFLLGVGGMMASPLARQTAARSDLLLTVGAALDTYNTDNGELLEGKEVIRIERDGGPARWQPPGTRVQELTGDAAEILGRLVGALPGQPRLGWRTGQLGQDLLTERDRRERLAGEILPDGANPHAVVRTLDQQLPADARMVVGIGHFWYYVAPYLSAASGRDFQFGCGFGCIGQAVPLAVGAAVAEPDRLVVAFEGDGSMPMNLAELQSAVRLKCNLLVIVLNNGAYGSEYYKLMLGDLDPASSRFDRPMDTVAVASAMGVTARAVTDPAQLRPVLRGLLAMTGVRLLDISIARSLMSEVYQRQHGPLPALPQDGTRSPAPDYRKQRASGIHLGGSTY